MGIGGTPEAVVGTRLNAGRRRRGSHAGPEPPPAPDPGAPRVLLLCKSPREAAPASGFCSSKTGPAQLLPKDGQRARGRGAALSLCGASFCLPRSSLWSCQGPEQGALGA